MDAEDILDLRHDLYVAHQMVAEMADLLRKLHSAWSAGDDDSVSAIIDSDVYNMLKRLAPQDDDR